MQQETSERKKDTWLQRALAAVRKNRRLELAVYGGILLVVVLLYTASLLPKASSGAQKTLRADGEESADTGSSTEERLRNVLSSIRGAGRVEVMITYETGTELVPAMSKKVDSNSAQTSDGEKSSTTVQTNEVSEPATVSGSGGNAPIVLLEREPVVRGVIVVAEGAADIRVKLDLERAVQAVLDIPLNRIEVFELSNTAYYQEGG